MLHFRPEMMYGKTGKQFVAVAGSIKIKISFLAGLYKITAIQVQLAERPVKEWIVPDW